MLTEKVKVSAGSSSQLRRHSTTTVWLPVALLVGFLVLALPLSAAAQFRGEDPARLSERAFALHQEGELSAAIRVMERALAAGKRKWGAENHNVATSMANLAFLCQADGRRTRAEHLYLKALRLRETLFGRQSIEVAGTLRAMAELHESAGDYAGAESSFRQELAILQKVRGPRDPYVAITLDDLARLHRLRANFARAESLHRRALAIREQTLGRSHAAVATSLNNLAVLYEAMGNYERARPLAERALVVLEKARGPEHPDLATLLNNVGALLKHDGQYARAGQLYERALAIREKALGPHHPKVAIVLTNMGALYEARSAYDSAEPLFRRALAIRERAFGPNHHQVAAALNALAVLHQGRGKYAQAEPLLQRALAIVEGRFGRKHPKVALTLNNLAELYHLQGDFDRALPLFQRALGIDERIYGPKHPRVATALNNLGSLYQARKEYDRAEPLLRRALAITSQSFGPQHPHVAATLFNLYSVYAASGDVTRAVEHLGRAVEVREQVLQAILATGSEEQKRSFLSELRGEAWTAVSLHLNHAPQSAAAQQLAMTTLLRRKGRLLEASADTLRVIRQTADETTRRQLDELSTGRAALATRVLRGPAGEQKVAEHQAALAQLRRENARLEELLGRRYAALRAARQPVTLPAVQHALSEDAALIELAVYRRADESARTWRERFGSPRYVAYVLRAKGAPRWVDLGEAAPIDQQVHRLRAALAQARPDVGTLAQQLDELVMKPVRPLLGDARDVHISPDGALNLVPFGALIDEQGRFLVSQYRFTYLTSGRDLLRLRHRSEARSPALVVADPAYGDGRPSTPTAGAARGRDVDMGKIRFTSLPGTAAEAQALAGLIEGATQWLGPQATEGALKGVTGPRLLHIATHGFFLGDVQLPAAPDTLRGLSLATSRATLPSNPLLRSGLAFAGANARSSGGEDGILTALEMSNLDLHGTRLVVLSACDTGVGQVHNGEGVYGLRRALVLAGAQSQVMSLWKVDDDRTRELMTGYYRRLRSGQGRSEAMRQTQLAMVERAETRHPFFWAAFIVSGDGRSLDGRRAGAVEASSAGTDTRHLLGVRGPRSCSCAHPGKPTGSAGLSWLGALCWLGAGRLVRRNSRRGGRRSRLQRMLPLRSLTMLSALCIFAVADVAQADIVRSPPKDCPEGHKAVTNHRGPHCQPPPPTNCPPEHLPKVYRELAYCEPPPVEPCQPGSFYASKSKTDTYCVAEHACKEDDDCQEGKCVDTSFCIRWAYPGGRRRLAIAAGNCSDEQACSEGTECIESKRCDRADKRVASSPSAAVPGSTGSTPPGATSAPDSPTAQTSPSPTPKSNGCAGCSVGAARRWPSAALLALALGLVAGRRRRLAPGPPGASPPG